MHFEMMRLDLEHCGTKEEVMDVATLERAGTKLQILRLLSVFFARHNMVDIEDIHKRHPCKSPPISMRNGDWECHKGFQAGYRLGQGVVPWQLCVGSFVHQIFTLTEMPNQSVTESPRWK